MLCLKLWNVITVNQPPQVHSFSTRIYLPVCIVLVTFCISGNTMGEVTSVWKANLLHKYGPWLLFLFIYFLGHHVNCSNNVSVLCVSADAWFQVPGGDRLFCVCRLCDIVFNVSSVRGRAVRWWSHYAKKVKYAACVCAVKVGASLCNGGGSRK